MLEKVRIPLDSVNKKLEKLDSKVTSIKAGICIYIVSIALFLGIPILIGALLGPKADRPFSLRIVFMLIILTILAILEYFLRSNAREKKANLYYEERIGPLLQEKAIAEADYYKVYNSDEGYNARMILPERYSTVTTVDTLIELVSYRRAANIPEAFKIYDEIQRQKRLEEIEKEKLKAAQEASAAQKRAADAAERAAKSAQNTEQLTRQMKQNNERNQVEQREWMQRQANKSEEAVSTAKSQKGIARKECPYCGEPINVKASYCPYCHDQLPIWWYL